MKKALSFLFVFLMIFVCGCKDKVDNTSEPTTTSSPKVEVPEGDKNTLLTDAEWVGSDGRCENTMTFGKDNFFGNSCACGEPVGFADVTEIYSYNEKDKTIDLFDCDGEKLETGKILFLDKMYLVVQVWDDVYVYANEKGYIPTVHDGATEHVNTEETFPCLCVLDYKDGMFTVSSHDYDGDAAKDFDLWELKAAENITFKSVSVVDDKGTVIVDDVELPESEYQHIGEYYTHGFFEFNEKAEVTHITFYGELIIY